MFISVLDGSIWTTQGLSMENMSHMFKYLIVLAPKLNGFMPACTPQWLHNGFVLILSDKVTTLSYILLLLKKLSESISAKYCLLFWPIPSRKTCNCKVLRRKWKWKLIWHLTSTAFGSIRDFSHIWLYEMMPKKSITYYC